VRQNKREKKTRAVIMKSEIKKRTEKKKEKDGRQGRKEEGAILTLTFTFFFLKMVLSFFVQKGSRPK